ncbi:MAG: hypothetical protein Q7R41_10730 [Phycisphaerales bacterium]|nr:hypothetical protein [Phycisphaerales bacterium]
MKEYDTTLQEIVRDERWFAETLAASERVETERIKLRVRVEIGERWLSDKLHDPSASRLVDATRERVRTALQEARADGPVAVRMRGWSGRQWVAAAGAVMGVAAALVIVLTGVGGIENAEKMTTPVTNVPSNKETELIALSAFEQSGQVDEDVDQSLEELEKEIADWGQRVVGRGGESGADTLYDDFWESMDSSDMDGEGADEPVGAAWRVRESGV